MSTITGSPAGVKVRCRAWHRTAGSTGIVAGWLALTAVGAVAMAHAEPAAPVVVELFTSQGCSSCPPADAFLAELARRSDVLPLAFHVDYWDRLGWRDPFSSSAATARQRDYARELGLPTVYTPQIVVNGRHDAVGSDRRQVTAAIAATAGPSVPIALAVENGALSIGIGTGSGAGKLWLVTFDPRHETAVTRGENAGRTLVDINIVRSLDAVGAWDGSPITLSRPLPPAGSGAALLLQAQDGRILGAASIRAPG